MERYINSNYLGDNTRIYIHQNEIVSNHMVNINNFFEIEFLDYIQKNHNKQNEVIDIGANIGNHSLFFAKFLDVKKVHSFEPFPSNLSLLRKNMTNFSDKSQIYDIALSNKEGLMPLYNSQHGNFGGFSLHSYSNGSSFLVNPSIKVTTLDSLNLQNISMIKIDVENHENEVLEGAKQTILNNKPIIFVENLYYKFLMN